MAAATAPTVLVWAVLLIAATIAFVVRLLHRMRD
jgi:hypothetical protein